MEIRTGSVNVPFRMNRAIITVHDAWKEWKYGGLTANNVVAAPIEQLESISGKKWRGAMSSTEGKFFSRRKPLYVGGEQLIKDGKTESEMVQILDEFRLARCNGSLRKLCDHIAEMHSKWDKVSPFTSYFR